VVEQVGMVHHKIPDDEPAIPLVHERQDEEGASPMFPVFLTSIWFYRDIKVKHHVAQQYPPKDDKALANGLAT
jgi:hypothetical protein